MLRSMLVLVLCAGASPLAAQAPFVTDDAEVAPHRHWHFEFNNEYDLLQHSAYPNLRQNTANFKTSYGLVKNVEVGFDNQLLAISNAPTPALPRTAFGYGDLDLSVKWKILPEKQGWLRPALGASFNLELPTGDARRQLGSGITDYYLNSIAQKSLTDKTTLRLNGGYYFAGNTLTGVVGIRRAKGGVFTGSGSLVHAFTKKLDLGAEIAGAVSRNFDLARGQLQIQFGGNYKIRQSFSLDFGLITGFYQSSPRLGPIIGFSKDF